VLWLSRPPYLRWLGAAAILGLALWIELRPRAEVDHPFARFDLAAGSVVDEEAVEWRAVPGGVLPPVELGGLALVNIPAGEPLSPALVATDLVEPPEGWWALEAPLPAGALPGGSVRLVLLPSPGAQGPPQVVEGEVMAGMPADPLNPGEPTGLVAIPAEAAAPAAAAVAEGRAVVLVGGGFTP
jgi:hypothetical protein